MTTSVPVRPSYKSVILIVVTLGLLLGVGLFLCEKQHEVTLPVTVEFEHIPADLIALRDTPPVLEAHLKGPSSVLKGLRDSELSCSIDLSEAKPGPLLIKMSADMIETPWRVSVLAVDPASFTIIIDKRMEKIVPIVPDLKKDPAPGYVISRVLAEPSMVRIIGPMSVLDKMSAVRTTPIDVGGLTETIKKRVALNLNHNPHIKAVGDGLVEVQIMVNHKIVEKWLNVAVQTSGGKYRYVITPDRIEILLRGPVTTLKNLAETNAIEVYVDLEGLKPGTYVRRAVIKPPLNTTLVEAKPEVFTVKVLD